MAITFENIYKDRVIDNIQKLIKTSVPAIPLLFNEHRGQESFLIVPVSDGFVDLTAMLISDNIQQASVINSKEEQITISTLI